MEGNVWEWAASGLINGEPWANRRGASWVACDEIESASGRANSPLIGIPISFKVPISIEHRYDDIGFRCMRP